MVSRGHVATDVVAGIITACVVAPQAIAYASIAGLPAEVGLYAALAPMLVYALLGTSSVLSVSVTSTLAILTASTLAVAGDTPEVAAALAVVVGVILLVAGIGRLGFLADLVSIPILAGFKAGTGLIILSGQLGKVFGIPVGGDGFFENVADLFRGLDDIQGWTTLLGTSTIVLLVVLKRGSSKIPGPLVAVALGIAAVVVFDLADRGVAVIGSVPSGLPTLDVPDLSDWRLLVPGAAGIALMSTVESVAAGRALARRDEPPIDASRELVALGCANVAGGFFQAFPGGGGLSQSAMNREAGARTQLSSIATVGVVALVLTVLTGLLADLAQATLGALVIVAAAGLVRPQELQRILQVRRRDGLLAIVALAGVLVFGVLPGVLLAIVASVVTLVTQANRLPVTVIPSDQPGLLILRPHGFLHFANVEGVRRQIVIAVDRARPAVDVLVLDLVAVPDVEITALTAIAESVSDLRAGGVEMWLADLNPGEREMLDRFGIEPGATVFASVDDAVVAYRSRTPTS